MKMRSLGLFGVLIAFTACVMAQPSERYLAQSSPGQTPQIFAPGIVSKVDEHEFGSVFSEDGYAFYYGVDTGGKAEIRVMRFQDNTWSESAKLLVSDQYGYNDPFLSPDERRLYFISDRPLDGVGKRKDIDIWYVERDSNGQWSEPINAGEPINSEKNEYYISFTTDGTMYFSSNVSASQEREHDFDIYSSRSDQGKFREPVKLPAQINSPDYEADVFVAYDESYLIFSGIRPEGLGRGDLYISFRTDDGGWSPAKNMGELINTKGHELCPFVTRDGQYLFYTSNQDIYWVEASVIDQLR